MMCVKFEKPDLERIRLEAEEVFGREYEEALIYVKAKHPALHPSRQRDLARRIARRAMDRYLKENYDLTMADIEAKLQADELDVDLEDLAV